MKAWGGKETKIPAVDGSKPGSSAHDAGNSSKPTDSDAITPAPPKPANDAPGSGGEDTHTAAEAKKPAVPTPVAESSNIAKRRWQASLPKLLGGKKVPESDIEMTPTGASAGKGKKVEPVVKPPGNDTPKLKPLAYPTPHRDYKAVPDGELIRKNASK